MLPCRAPTPPKKSEFLDQQSRLRFNKATFGLLIWALALQTSVPLTVRLVLHFGQVCTFGDFYVLSGPQVLVLKSRQVLPSARRLWCARRRKYICGELHSGVSYSAVGCEFSVHGAKYGISKKRKKKPDDLYVRSLWKMQKSHLECVIKLWKKWKSS